MTDGLRSACVLALGALSLGAGAPAQAMAYDFHYSFYVTNSRPGFGGEALDCTGDCLAGFLERIGLDPSRVDLESEYTIDVAGVSRFYSRDNSFFHPDVFEVSYTSRSGSTPIGRVDWGKVDLEVFPAQDIDCGGGYAMSIGGFAPTCVVGIWPDAPSFAALVASQTSEPLEYHFDLGDMLGSDGSGYWTRVPEPGSLALLATGFLALALSRRRQPA